jgi:hypothetical protein
MSKKLKIFISWSGDRSKAAAKVLREYLPILINAVDPWMSEEEIGKGSRGLQSLSKELESAQFGILCMTDDNLMAPWIMFEAGAISKEAGNSKVSPVLFGIDRADIQGPLTQFQSTLSNDKSDFLRLLKAMNDALGVDSIPETRLEQSLEIIWPKLSSALATLPDSGQPKPTRTERQLLEEVLEIVRADRRGRTSLRHAEGRFGLSSQDPFPIEVNWQEWVRDLLHALAISRGIPKVSVSILGHEDAWLVIAVASPGISVKFWIPNMLILLGTIPELIAHVTKEFLSAPLGETPPESKS